jgi:hypothetical protein
MSFKREMLERKTLEKNQLLYKRLYDRKWKYMMVVGFGFFKNKKK